MPAVLALDRARGGGTAERGGSRGVQCWVQVLRDHCHEDQETAVPPRPPPRSKPGAAVGAGTLGPSGSG